MATSEVEMKEFLSQNTGEQFVLTSDVTMQEDAERLKSLVLSGNGVAQVRESLGAIIDSMHANPSLVTRFAEYWGKIPTWQKITGGVILTIPTLTVGLAAHLGVLLAFSGFTVVAYGAGSIILDDHYVSNKNIVDNLKAGVFGIADILIAMIDELHKLCDNYRAENDRYHRENELFQQQNKQLHIENSQYHHENERLTRTSNELQDKVYTLNEQLNTLLQVNAHLKQQATKLEQTTQELEAIKSDLAKNEQLMAAKIAEIQQVKEEMTKDNLRVKHTASILKTGLDALAGINIDNEAKRNVFLRQIESIVDGKFDKLGEVAERLTETEEQLAITQKQLEEKNSCYEKLLDRYEQLIKQQEALFHEWKKNHIVVSSEPKTVSYSGNMHSLYAKSSSPLSAALTSSSNVNSPAFN